MFWTKSRDEPSPTQDEDSTAGSDIPAILPELLPRLWAFSIRLTNDRHDAEDLVQRACVRALERAHQFQPGTSALSWMFSIVHSTWINELRSRQVRSRSVVQWDEDALEQVADAGAATPEQNAMNNQIVNAVLSLPDAQRVVMLLVAVEGLSYSEAAQVLDIPIGTVMSRMSRARVAIGAMFESGKPASGQSASANRDPAL